MRKSINAVKRGSEECWDRLEGIEGCIRQQDPPEPSEIPGPHIMPPVPGPPHPGDPPPRPEIPAPQPPANPPPTQPPVPPPPRPTMCW